MNVIKLSTPVVFETDWRCRYSDRFVTIGSCFSDTVGQRMRQCGMDVMVNPFGTLYNPASIATGISRCLDGMWIEESDLVTCEGFWHSWFHHSSFSRNTKEECIEACNASMRAFADRLRGGCKLLVTFGTAFVFKNKEICAVVGNCHKLPADQFVRRRLSVSEIVEDWNLLLDRLTALGVEVLFTVSPIRHFADGAHGNQLSKGTLLLAVDELVSRYEGCRYFPAYEIVMDELRDYRFYGRDMVHPSDVAIDVVWGRFMQSYLSPADIALCESGWKSNCLAEHRRIINSNTIK
ncbi:MAG: GSCFA domain-containing protein [Bacteroidales bacterium]|nr:GSCFA domain-containing protein [Candidatus Colimorpha pelethequi]